MLLTSSEKIFLLAEHPNERFRADNNHDVEIIIAAVVALIVTGAVVPKRPGVWSRQTSHGLAPERRFASGQQLYNCSILWTIP